MPASLPIPFQQLLDLQLGLGGLELELHLAGDGADALPGLVQARGFLSGRFRPRGRPGVVPGRSLGGMRRLLGRAALEMDRFLLRALLADAGDLLQAAVDGADLLVDLLRDLQARLDAAVDLLRSIGDVSEVLAELTVLAQDLRALTGRSEIIRTGWLI